MAGGPAEGRSRPTRGAGPRPTSSFPGPSPGRSPAAVPRREGRRVAEGKEAHSAPPPASARPKAEKGRNLWGKIWSSHFRPGLDWNYMSIKQISVFNVQTKAFSFIFHEWLEKPGGRARSAVLGRGRFRAWSSREAFFSERGGLFPACDPLNPVIQQNDHSGPGKKAGEALPPGTASSPRG